MTITELRKLLLPKGRLNIFLTVTTTVDHLGHPTGSSYLQVNKTRARTLLKGLAGHQQAAARFDEDGNLIIG